MKGNLTKDTQAILAKIYGHSKFKRYFQFVFGCLLVALAFNLFFATNDIVAGGVSGLSIILKHYLGIDTSMFIFISNILLLVLSYFALGKETTKANILGSLLFPVFVNLTQRLSVYVSFNQSEMLLVAIFGGLLQGIGAGLIFKAGFSTGGTDILNMIVSKKFKISMGSSMLCTDGLIVGAGLFIFGFNKLMYALIVLYIISMATDRVLLGISDSKAFYIITKEEDRVKDFILNTMKHGVTVFQAQGGYELAKQDVLMCIIPTKDYYVLKEGIHEIDQGAFFVVTDAYQVFGGEYNEK